MKRVRFKNGIDLIEEIDSADSCGLLGIYRVGLYATACLIGRMGGNNMFYIYRADCDVVWAMGQLDDIVKFVELNNIELYRPC
jgi:hypothetical protein